MIQGQQEVMGFTSLGRRATAQRHGLLGTTLDMSKAGNSSMKFEIRTIRETRRK